MFVGSILGLFRHQRWLRRRNFLAVSSNRLGRMGTGVPGPEGRVSRLKSARCTLISASTNAEIEGVYEVPEFRAVAEDCGRGGRVLLVSCSRCRRAFRLWSWCVVKAGNDISN